MYFYWLWRQRQGFGVPREPQGYEMATRAHMNQNRSSGHGSLLGSLSLCLLVYSELILMRFAISYSVLYSNTGWSMYMRLYRWSFQTTFTLTHVSPLSFSFSLSSLPNCSLLCITRCFAALPSSLRQEKDNNEITRPFHTIVGDIQVRHRLFLTFFLVIGIIL